MVLKWVRPLLLSQLVASMAEEQEPQWFRVAVAVEGEEEAPLTFDYLHLCRREY